MGKFLAAVQLHRAVLRRLRNHVQRSLPVEDKRIGEVVGLLENDLCLAGLGIFENLDRRQTSLRREHDQFLEENEVSTLIGDGERVRPEAVLWRNQVA